VAGRAHEEQHHHRQERIGAAGEEGLAGHGFGFVGHGGAVGGVVAGPLDEAFLDAPDHSPDVEQHDLAHAAADSNGEQGGCFPPVSVEAEEALSCGAPFF